jgi:hypothetical protein
MVCLGVACTALVSGRIGRLSIAAELVHVDSEALSNSGYERNGILHYGGEIPPRCLVSDVKRIPDFKLQSRARLYQPAISDPRAMDQNVSYLVKLEKIAANTLVDWRCQTEWFKQRFEPGNSILERRR